MDNTFFRLKFPGLQQISARCLALVGKPVDEIVKTAEEENGAIIVIASHGESGWQRFLSGSITEKVLRMASCPVLVVPVPETPDTDE
jgi:nucleotide-binding universal stress UspA family protein